MQMGKIVWHIFYKEWIKTRWTYLAALVLGLTTVFYVFIRVENGMERFGAKTYMLKVLYDNPPLIYYRMLLYVPLLIAACVGVTQYLPETVNRRIRLMLHLPVANTRLVLGMALYGVAAVTVSNALLYGLFAAKSAALFPAEITLPALKSVLPWLLAAYPVYGFIAMVALEPNRWRAVVYAVTGYYLISPFVVCGEAPGSYFSSALPLLAIAAGSFPLLLYSSYRFSKGER